MRTRHLLLVLATVLCLGSMSAIGETRQQSGTPDRHAFILDSQIQDIAVEGDLVTFHLYMQPYDFVIAKWVPVKAFDQRHIYASDLLARDNVHVEGDFDHTVVHVSDITLQMRNEHRTTPVRNPIAVESQIRDIAIDGDSVTFHLSLQRYDFVVDKWVSVKAFDGRRMYARDLLAHDNVHVEGDLDHDVVHVNQITLQMRVEHLGGN